MNRAVLTGASGFIGYALLQELLQNDYEVLAVVHSIQSAENLKKINHQNLHVVSCDIPDFSALYSQASGKYDVFFHIAWGVLEKKIVLFSYSSEI